MESKMKSMKSKLKSIESKLKWIESKLKSIEIYHFFHFTLFRPVSLKISTLKRLKEVFGGGSPH